MTVLLLVADGIVVGVDGIELICCSARWLLNEFCAKCNVAKRATTEVVKVWRRAVRMMNFGRVEENKLKSNSVLWLCEQPFIINALEKYRKKKWKLNK